MAAKIEGMKSSKLFKSLKSGSNGIRNISLRSSGNSVKSLYSSGPTDVTMSAADVAALVAEGYSSGVDSGDDAFGAQSEERASTNIGDSDDDESYEEPSSNNALDVSLGSKTNILDSNALLAKLGPSPTIKEIASFAATKVQEHIIECFDADSSLDKEKFDAIPRYVKSDLLIGAFLGKGSFSDAFEVTLTVKTREPKLGRWVSDAGKEEYIDAAIVATASQFGGEPSVEKTPKPSPITHGQNASINEGRHGSRRASSPDVNRSVCIGSFQRPSNDGAGRKTLAMKCLRPQIRANAEQYLIGVEDIIREAAILASLDHPNIIKIHGRSGGDVSDSFRMIDGYFILIDRLTDTLEDRVKRWKKAPRESKKGPSINQIRVMSSLADAVLFLHQNSICFRDLKPANVGFDDRGCLKLFDFGFAVSVDEDNTNALFQKCGTLRYMAPEVGLGLGYGLEADVFSFGVILWEVFTLKKPFHKVKSAAEFEALVFEKDSRPKIKKTWNEALKNLISACWARNPQERPAMSVVKSILVASAEEVSRGDVSSGNSLRKSIRGSIARRVTWD